ncbi:MAG: 30S ribosomal protein S9 [Candidatus Pacebacteria bacterium]|jgi:small subunit ribosomal protein S9|nr:30S ribosomal protein S9 [Candidatus Paceibacterota bacterium]MBT3511505.1 30S ribosomal protein S9 [Candidatus Paceibacterota bacterium]MBT4005025.1 30S ribosomal protein S9 [Candidatus Paceibacterota bacterium]MBT4358801.1 30S ribosomal protein S9 [Candidatus Paceibacterota bacterium]MBT4680609.1 30S ribosomal protein S9 [Candidatus Paceibacterota bacterium]
MAKKISIQPKKIIRMARQQQQRSKVQRETGPKFEVPAGRYTEGVGRRKVATSRVRIYEQKDGQFIVNDQLAKDYFSNIPQAAKILDLPFELTGTQGKFAVTVKVKGSGIKAQLEAVTHGLSRALVKFEESFRALLKEDSMLTRDSRMKESRKPGRGGKARRKRQSPRR